MWKHFTFVHTFKFALFFQPCKIYVIFHFFTFFSLSLFHPFFQSTCKISRFAGNSTQLNVGTPIDLFPTIPSSTAAALPTLAFPPFPPLRFLFPLLLLHFSSSSGCCFLQQPNNHLSNMPKLLLEFMLLFGIGFFSLENILASSQKIPIYTVTIYVRKLSAASLVLEFSH